VKRTSPPARGGSGRPPDEDCRDDGCGRGARKADARAAVQGPNHHTAACGAPPAVDGDATGTYVGYFENEYGEQAIYTYEHETGEATIRMGDGGWHDAYRVNDGQAEGLLLGKTETIWLVYVDDATSPFADRKP
jgi:hypothetical protein